MKPFNLEAALRGEPVMYMDGRKALRVVHLPEAKQNDRVIVLLDDQSLCAYSENGALVQNYEPVLFMAPRTVTRWFNHYQDYSQGWVAEEEAKDRVAEGCLAIAVPMEIEL